MRKIVKVIKIIVLILLIQLLALVIVQYLPKSTLLNDHNPIFKTGIEETYVKTYPSAYLEQLWVTYRDRIQKDGRTIDRSQNYLTTSEGQSYSLLRSVWMDDKETFDRVLRWTNNNLQKRPHDMLFAWKWGQDSNGKWDVLASQGGINTASDADQDIALALIFASKRWNNDDYLEQAQVILDDIWKTEVYESNGKYYMVAGNWAKVEKQPTINPSYFSLAAYPIFAEVDPSHPWMKIKDSSYEVLDAATISNLDKDTSANLPPDWVSLDPKSGNIISSVHKDKLTHFSDDAIRIPLRVALDWQWHQDPRAKAYLEKLDFLANEWNTRTKISETYAHDGTIESDNENNSMYGALVPYFKVVHPEIADAIYYKKLAYLYNPDTEDFKNDIGYYAQNIVWFGMAGYQGKLLNLYDIHE